MLHALNRFTFGPRPGDVQAVEKIGLKKWFNQQLNPEKIDDAKLQAMLPELSGNAVEPGGTHPQVPAAEYSAANVPQRRRVAERSSRTRHLLERDAELRAADRRRRRLPQAMAKKPTDNDGANQMIPAMDATMTPDAATNTPTRPEGRQLTPLPAFSRQDAFAILKLSPDERMAKILAMPPEQVAAFRRAIPPGMQPRLMQGLSPEQVEIWMALQGPIRVVGAEALETRLLRDVYSERQLEAVMTDFWLNHFSVYVRKNQNQPYLLPAFERDTVRPNALGKFEDLLVATAESPAMMMYLDNWQSIGPDSPAAKRSQQFARRAKNPQVAALVPKGINENYARELMELHTLGARCEVSGMKTQAMLDPSCGRGYTQADVQNVAKVLTGWTIDRPYAGGGQAFEFDERRHEGGSKQVLGQTIEAAGQKEGLQVLHILATSPATAQYISHKLAVRFVSDNPPRALEDRMAKTFLVSGGDIKAVLKTLFDSPETWSADVYRAKVKTPIEFVASALRASDAQVANPLPLVQAMERLGMPIYGRQTPDGYPWHAGEWVSTNALVSRMNFALVMSGDLLPGTKTDWPKLLGETAATETEPTAKTEAELEKLLMGQPVTEKTRSAVLEQGGKPGQAREAQKNLALGTGEDAMAGPQKEGFAKGKGKRPYQPGQNTSMTELASNSGKEGPVPTMAGLLLGSPEFQRR